MRGTPSRKQIIAARVRLRAHISVMHKGAFVAVIDRDDGAMSVTNDAERVIDFLREIGDLKIPGTRVIYRDSEGRWDEIAVKDGHFVGFKHVGAKSPDEAVAILTRGAH